MNKAIDDILKQYPYLMDDVRKEQIRLNEYIELQQDARDPLKGQTLSDMPHMPDGNTSDQTYNAIERIIDLYQAEIDSCVAKINELLDRKKWLDKAYETLTEDERRILYLRYDERFSERCIAKRMKMDRTTISKTIINAKEKVHKIVL